ncbi:MAG: STAS domain-containing protein [Bacteroidota bacterium]
MGGSSGDDHGAAVSGVAAQASDELRRELAAHLRDRRDELRQRWVEEMAAKGLMVGLSRDGVQTASETIYDALVDAVETGRYDGIQAHATLIAERSAPARVTPDRVLEGFLRLREILSRHLTASYRDMAKLTKVLDIYVPVADRILCIVASAFVEEREKVVRQQQEAIRELSTPVLRVRDRLLILPIIGVLDTHRARQLTEQLLYSIRANRAKVVIMDVTGVASMDSKVANHLVQTVEAAQLLGATVLVTGISPEAAQTLVAIGVDLSRLRTVCDLQSGLEEADRLLGLKATTA